MTTCHPSWSLEIKLREWQLQALEAWTLNYRGIVNVVTGGGKTVFAQVCILAFLEKFHEGRIIVIVPTVTLMDQWQVSLQEDLHVSPKDIACYSGEEKPSKPRKINILVINTARKVATKLAQNINSFLIVDECHRAGSPSNALALQGEHQATLGLSATPEREYDEGFAEIIEPVLGNIIYNYDYVQARHDKVICPFELVNAQINLLEHEQKEYNKFTKKIATLAQKIDHALATDDYLKILLQRRAAISAKAVMRLPAAIKLLDKHRGQRVIIFHERVDEAERLLDLVKRRKHSVIIYHSGIGAAIRRDNLRLFRRGLFDVLICCRALDEGINIPETTVAIIASSTASTRQRIQRLGRILRPAPGKDLATIYTLYATETEKKRLIQEAKNLNEIVSIKWIRIS